MPSGKDRAKATGDTHLPEIDLDEFHTQKSRPAAAAMPGSRIRAGWRNGSGDLSERAAPAGDSAGDTGDIQER